MASVNTSLKCTEQNAVNISEDQVSQWLYTTAETVFITVLLPFVLSFGTLTNLSFLFVMFRIPKMRTDTYIYLANLALADLLFITLASTYTIWKYLASPVVSEYPVASKVDCFCQFTIINTGYFAGIALVTMMTIERYLAMCHPFKHLKIRGRKRTWRLVVMCWLVGLVFAAATAIRVPRVSCLQWPDDDAYDSLPSFIKSCVYLKPWQRYYTPPLLNLPWLITMVVSMYMYVRIIQVLNNRKGIEGRQQVRNQVAKMLIVNGMVFFLGQTPYRVLSISNYVCFLAQIPDPLRAALGNSYVWISLVPEYINLSVNPLIYSAMCAKYRAAFRQAFRFRLWHRSQARRHPNPTISQKRERYDATVTTETSANQDTCHTQL